MHKIEWDDQLKIGIEEIDNQHHELVVIYNQLCDAIEARQGPEKTLEIFRHLGHYTTVHFATEESVMRMLGYPEYEPHKEAHDRLIQELKVLIQSAEKSPQGVNFQLMFMIKQWLSRHILETDKQYVPFFVQAGIKTSMQKKNWLSKFNLFG